MIYGEPMKVRRRRVAWAAVLVAVVLVAGWLVIRRIRGPVVPVVAVREQEIVRTIVASGRVIAAEEATVGAERTGTIARVLVDEGDVVRAGQVLIELDAAAGRAAVARARAALAAARAQVAEVEGVTADVAAASLAEAEAALAEARDRARRMDSLFAADAISTAERDAARYALEQAESRVASTRAQLGAAREGGTGLQRARARVAESEAALAAAEAGLAESVIRAPAGGTILRRNVEPGDVAQPGAPLLRIAFGGAPQLLIEPDEKNLSDLALGQEARASADAFPQDVFAAVVTEIAPAVDARRGTIDVKLDIPHPPAYLRPDMTVSVEIVTGRSAEALAVPLAGIQGRAGAAGAGERPWVFVVRDGRAARQPVRLGMEGEEAVQVTAGLREGDRVVANPRASLRPGQRVRADEIDEVAGVEGG